jgi:hypothetical protein
VTTKPLAVRTSKVLFAYRGGERSFRYASLASGLDLIQKAVAQQHIAVMQSTAVDPRARSC